MQIITVQKSVPSNLLLSLAFTLPVSSLTIQSVYANDLPSDSVTLTTHVNKAADLYDKGEFARAKDEYRAVIASAPEAVEPYEGLLKCSEKTNDWSEVAFAASKIAALSPERKSFYEYDYGTALYNLNRYDEAIPHLKSALATADIAAPPFKPIRLQPPQGTKDSIQMLPKPQSEQGITVRPNPLFNPVADGQPGVTSRSSLDLAKLQNFENAIRSESICIAEYVGCDTADDVRFNSPPATQWHIERILKGPPLNRHLPLRYDFHTPDISKQPPDWKFDNKLLPQKGSKWIIFIEFAVPEGPRKLFTTYDGSYGRQPATEENLNELDRLLEEHHMKVQGL
jgi:tetratricopeptide (TPR) repeat protein